MDSNLANGGLVLKTGGKMYISDIRGGSGTFMGDEEGQGSYAGGSFWFMNAYGGSIYCSDLHRGGALVRFDTETNQAETLLDVPCYGIIRSGESLIYMNELDGRLYRSTLDARIESRIADEQVLCFVMKDDTVYYATDGGIRMCSSGGGSGEKIAGSVAARMILAGDKLVYADKDRHDALTILNLSSGETVRFDELSPDGLNTDGRYLYCANRRNGGTVYRVDPGQGRFIRICGERADYLHVIDEELYFYGNQEWYRMSLQGGKPLKVTT